MKINFNKNQFSQLLNHTYNKTYSNNHFTNHQNTHTLALISSKNYNSLLIPSKCWIDPTHRNITNVDWYQNQIWKKTQISNLSYFCCL